MLVFFFSMKGIMVKIQSINNTAIKSSTVGITVRFTLKNQNADLFISIWRTLAEWNCCGHPGWLCLPLKKQRQLIAKCFGCFKEPFVKAYQYHVPFYVFEDRIVDDSKLCQERKKYKYRAGSCQRHDLMPHTQERICYSYIYICEK